MAFYNQSIYGQNQSSYAYPSYNTNQYNPNYQQYGYQGQNYTVNGMNYQQSVPQQQVIPQSPQGINGKIVENLDVVKIQEIPIGGWAIFPQTDEKFIYLKKYMNDGTTKIITYAPQFEDKVEESKIDYSNELLEIKNSINVLDEKLSSLIS